MRILLVTSRIPLPAWRGNQVRTVEWLEALGGHELALVYPEPDNSPPWSLAGERFPYRLGLGSRTAGILRAAECGRPLQEGLYEVREARRAVSRALDAWQPHVVVVQMVRCGWAMDSILEIAPKTPVIFDAIDSMGLHFESAARSAPAPLSFLYSREATRCRRREQELADAATCTVAVSERDLDAIAGSSEHRFAIPVAGREIATTEVARTGPVILLSGNLGYLPTVRGARWFAAEVWPRLRTLVPEVRWVLAGARPSPAVKRIGRSPGIDLHADVPDLGPYLANARVAIAPMSSGSGVPMKVLEAMAAGVPAVVHPWAAEGLTAEANDAVIVASGAEAWVAALEPLLREPASAGDLGGRGYEIWQRFYHPERVAQQIREVVREAGLFHAR
jgi:glycosyltransferase involved in cell wall biosynthesis